MVGMVDLDIIFISLSSSLVMFSSALLRYVRHPLLARPLCLLLLVATYLRLLAIFVTPCLIAVFVTILVTAVLCFSSHPLVVIHSSSSSSYSSPTHHQTAGSIADPLGLVI